MAPSSEISRVEALLQLRRWSEALSLVSGLLASDPQNPDLLYQQARALAGADRIAEAVTAARSASAHRPTWAAPVRFEASLLAPDQLRLAVGVARRATALGPVDAANWAVLADLCQRASFLREAVEAAAEARRLAPNSVMALNASGLVALRLRDTAEAEKWFRMGLATDPTDPALMNNLALALGRSGRDDEAMELFERSLSQAPDGSHAWGNLGRATAVAMWRGPVRWLFFGGAALLLVGLGASLWVVAAIGGVAIGVSLIWVSIRQRRMGAVRRRAVRDASRRGRRRIRGGVTRPLSRWWRDRNSRSRPGA